MMQMPMLQQKHNKTEKTAPKALDHCHLDSISCQQIQHIISDMGKCMYKLQNECHIAVTSKKELTKASTPLTITSLLKS